MRAVRSARGRTRPPGDRPARARARAPARAGRAAVHRRPSAPTRPRRRGPAQHLAARFCAKEAVTQGAGARRPAPARHRGRRRHRRGARARAARRGRRARRGARRPGLGLADPHADDGRRRGGGGAVTLPAWLERPARRRARCARPTAGRSRSAASRRSSSWSAPVAGSPRSSSALAPRGPSPSSAARATTAATATSPRGCCASAGREVVVLAVAPVGELRGDAARERRAAARRAAASRSRPARLDGAAVAVDALLGTGFDAARRAARPREAIDRAAGARGARRGVRRAQRRRRVAPARSRGAAVRARATATFARRPSPGCGSPPARRTRARSRSSTSASRRARRCPSPTSALIARRPAAGARCPRGEAAGTKFTSGHVLVAGGSRGLTGAPVLARSGRRARRRRLRHRLRARARAADPRGQAHRGHDARAAATRTAPTPRRAPTRSSRSRRAAAARSSLGPGLGRTDGAVAFARRLAAEAEVPLVLDADGLNAHAGRLEDLAARARRRRS